MQDRWAEIRFNQYTQSGIMIDKCLFVTHQAEILIVIEEQISCIDIIIPALIFHGDPLETVPLWFVIYFCKLTSDVKLWITKHHSRSHLSP